MTTADRVLAFLRENFYVEGEIAPGASLLGEGVMDSTGVLELVGFLEESFGISVDDAEMVPDNLDSVDAIAAFVARKAAGEGAVANREGAERASGVG